MINTQRIIEKLDVYLHKKDFFNAEKHLLYWLNEASVLKEEGTILTIYNELIGFYRKQKRKDECMKICENTLSLINNKIYDGTIIKATTYINIGTAYKSFEKSELAIDYYVKADEIYSNNLDKTDIRFGALYNNMALAFLDLGKIDEAEKLFFEAIEIMSKDKKNYPEVAVSFCNLCDLEVKRVGIEKSGEKVDEYLKKAKNYLDEAYVVAEEKNYVFVCEKCMETFSYYGYFVFENEIRERVKSIYEGTQVS